MPRLRAERAPFLREECRSGMERWGGRSPSQGSVSEALSVVGEREIVIRLPSSKVEYVYSEFVGTWVVEDRGSTWAMQEARPCFPPCSLSKM